MKSHFKRITAFGFQEKIKSHNNGCIHGELTDLKLISTDLYAFEHKWL